MEPGVLHGVYMSSVVVVVVVVVLPTFPIFQSYATSGSSCIHPLPHGISTVSDAFDAPSYPKFALRAPKVDPPEKV